MNVFFSALIVCSFILSLVACLFAVRSAAVVRALLDQLTHFPLSRLQSLETWRDECTEELADLVNRFKMMKVRNAARHGEDSQRTKDGMPDPYKDPDGWRAAMNSRLARAKVGQ